jgi:repressor LexA
MTIGEKIKQARLAKGYTQEELGNLVGVKKAAINKYESGIVQNLKRSMIAKLADALSIDPVTLIGFDDQLPKDIVPISQLQRHRIPVLGSMAAGEPVYDPEFPDVVVDGPLDADFALRVHGDSMQPGYLDGDLVFLRSVPDVPHNGSVCAVSVDNEAALKHVFRYADHVLLTSDNQQYEPMQYSFVEHDIRILGVPVGFLRMYK